MVTAPTDATLVAATSALLLLAFAVALALVLSCLRRPLTPPLAVATALVVACTVTVAVAPVELPLAAGLPLALLGVAVGVVGGNPVTRRVLDLAAAGRVRETEDGGIVVGGAAGAVMRGGTAIGYLERLSVVVAIVAGYPEAIAVVVAVKGIGRFSELASSEARERFIVGTLASLLWAAVVGATVRLAIW